MFVKSFEKYNKSYKGINRRNISPDVTTLLLDEKG